MCEFKVLLDEEMVAKDVTYAKKENGVTILWGIIGQVKRYENVEIIEVNVKSQTLKLRKRI